MKHRVYWDCTTYAPHRWDRNKARLFGEKNEGAEVEATTPEVALSNFAKANNLNPFYLTTDAKRARGWGL